ncbi:DUF1998 domain-containing protein [Cellulosimicrobium cellulans]|uniref:DUF1998 domain-containing protein n=1 Tax=Cellulosimicrobium cellulans TaxID=1710 RepID=UPI002097A8C5|nr:DUF1998 domain-containing protein [Cellulosimicrobium cellulans]MCO7271576.1 DUF1998 domain-containing protein [Cellulosimicrobium cellulans]
MTDVVEGELLDPLGDLESSESMTASKNRAKVGSARPSNLLYTYGPGSTMDLPSFTVMPAGLNDWESIWKRRQGEPPRVHAPRLLDAVKIHLGPQVTELRPFPWAPKATAQSKEGDDLGVPARVFPQWMRCTGCDMLGPLTKFSYRNTNPYRPDEARFEHEKCPGRRGKPSKRPVPTVPARYLLACPDGHLDEFPYDWWVHQGGKCPAADVPPLKMEDRTVGKGASATISCTACGSRRAMNEAQGEVGAAKLPRCRGRHPHLALFEKSGCVNQTKLMLLGASNLWFPATLSIVVMPESAVETTASIAADLLATAGPKRVEKWQDDLAKWLEFLEDEESQLANLPDDQLAAAVSELLAPPPSQEQIEEQRKNFDPVSLLVPEWNYLLRDPLGKQHRADDKSGLVLSPPEGGVHHNLEANHVARVLAIDKLRKVNAVLGFTRIDEMERANDVGKRLVRLTRDGRPQWTVATEDRGEGIYLQLDESAVAEWEAKVEATNLWEAHRTAHERNFNARFSETAKDVDPDTRFRPARYWLLHTLSHVLIREMAMYSGYSAASLSERIYAWKPEDGRPAAAGLLIVTTASDSDGTLGGLVQLSESANLERVTSRALRRALRCSSDPVCAHRTPKEPEDFLHGAACHTCAMASETSCERANRFLDRRFLVDLPGAQGLGFFH